MANKGSNFLIVVYSEFCTHYFSAHNDHIDDELLHVWYLTYVMQNQRLLWHQIEVLPGQTHYDDLCALGAPLLPTGIQHPGSSEG